MKAFTTIATPLLIIASFLASMLSARGQFTDCSTGLLQMPTAEMQEDGTFMITNSFLNKHSLPISGWDYNTFQYGVAISFWGRIEIGYVCTIFNGAWDPRPDKSEYWTIMRNQDRHFTGRVMLLREGEFGLDWMPALVVGVSDPVTGTGGDYMDIINTYGTGNGYFNRFFAVISKHFVTPWGKLGAHAGYQFNHRLDYPINAPCVGVDWTPEWFQHKGILDNMRFILEFDSRTVNIGFLASIWDNHFEAVFELQSFQWINFGLRYKLRIKK